MFAKQTSLVLAVAAAAAITTTAERADANNPGATMAGWATRDWQTFHSSFMGQVTIQPDGSLAGHFTIITNNDGEDTVFCRYERFRPNRLDNHSWNFDAFGQCLSASSGGYYAVANRIQLIDYGTPGPNLDYVDINYYGPVGPSVPGGLIQSGDFTYTP